MSVAKYVLKFDQLAKFAPDILATDTSRKNKFMRGLNPDIARYVDTGKEGPASYADAVQRALCSESWGTRPAETTETIKPNPTQSDEAQDKQYSNRPQLNRPHTHRSNVNSRLSHTPRSED